MPLISRIANRIAADTVTEFNTVPMVGKLNCSQKGGNYAILEVPKDFVESIYKAIWQEGMEKPPNYSPHISVITEEELEQIGGKDKIKEDGDEFEFTLDTIESCDPDGWDEMKMVYFVKVKSPQLEALRVRYGLTPLIEDDHEFHVSVSVIPEKKKAASVIERVTTHVLREAKTVQLYQNVGLKLDDTDLKRLSRKLKEIASIRTIEQAKDRWLREEVSGHGEETKTRFLVNDAWEKDKKAILIATGFFSDKQKLLPVKLQTVDRRLNKSGPMWELSWDIGDRSQKWVKGIVSLAKRFAVAIVKWLKLQKSGDLVQEVKVGKFRVLNQAMLDEGELREYVALINKASSRLPNRYCYGDIKITTKKELGHSSGAIAYYSSTEDNIAILTDVSDSQPVQSFVHEIGHRVWYRFIDLETKKDMTDLYGGTMPSVDVKQKDIVLLFMTMQANGSIEGRKMQGILKWIHSMPHLQSRIRQEATKANKFWEDIVADIRGFAADAFLDSPSDKHIISAVSHEFFGKKPWTPRASRTGEKFLNLLRQISPDVVDYLKKRRMDVSRVVDVNGLTDFVWKAQRVDFGGIFPTPYSQVDVKELWAESFAEVNMGRKVHPKVEALVSSYL